MIRQFDMDSCQPIGDENTACPNTLAPHDAHCAEPRLMTVAEAMAEEQRLQPDFVVMLPFAHLFV